MLRIFILLLLLLVNLRLEGQDIEVSQLTLEQVIEMARSNSISSMKALTSRENKYWQWRTFRSNYKPQLVLSGYLPEFKRAIKSIQQPDGSIQFQSVTNDNSSVNLGLIQNIGLTGGQISVNSYLERFHDFDKQQTRYGGQPTIISFTQPVFTFNALKWDSRIEPLKYEEGQKKYLEEIELTAKNASALFFDLLLAQVTLGIAEKNRTNNDTILKIAQVKYDMGKLPKNELLQLKLTVLNSKKSFALAMLNVETATRQLKSFIGFTRENRIELIIPDQIPDFSVNEEMAISEARKNRQEAVAFKRVRLEADRDIAKAKGDNGLNASFFGTFGLNNSAGNVPDIYKNPKDQQTVSLGFQIPIIDWGRSASRIKTAQANKKFVEYTIAQEEINFDQEIYTQVRQFSMLKEQMDLNLEADQTAQERYEISKNRYMLGDLGITDLNIALQEKDQAKRDYILSLKNFWDVYFNIRLLTLYDFEKGVTVDINQ